MWLSLIVCIGNGPRRPANYRSCFSVPVESILELLGSSSKSTMVHHSSVQLLHHSSVLFCTILQYSCTIRRYCSVPFISAVLHHSSVLFCTIRQHSSAPFISTVAPFIGNVLHHSSVQFSTIHQFSSAPFVSYSSAPFVSYSSAPFVSSVLHHSLAAILLHVSMLFYNYASMNNLATDSNTLCQQFNCITKS